MLSPQRPPRLHADSLLQPVAVTWELSDQLTKAPAGAIAGKHQSGMGPTGLILPFAPHCSGNTTGQVLCHHTRAPCVRGRSSWLLSIHDPGSRDTGQGGPGWVGGLALCSTLSVGFSPTCLGAPHTQSHAEGAWVSQAWSSLWTIVPGSASGAGLLPQESLCGALKGQVSWGP